MDLKEQLIEMYEAAEADHAREMQKRTDDLADWVRADLDQRLRYNAAMHSTIKPIPDFEVEPVAHLHCRVTTGDLVLHAGQDDIGSPWYSAKGVCPTCETVGWTKKVGSLRMLGEQLALLEQGAPILTDCDCMRSERASIQSVQPPHDPLDNVAAALDRIADALESIDHQIVNRIEPSLSEMSASVVAMEVRD